MNNVNSALAAHGNEASEPTVGESKNPAVKRLSLEKAEKFSVRPWSDRNTDPATGWRPMDTYIKYSNIFSKAKLFFYLILFGKNLNRPYYGHYQVTRRCNFRCPSCQMWQDEEYAKGLSLDEMKILARNLRKVGLKSIAITGGEATLRKDIVSIVEIFRKAGLIIRFQTNAFLLTEGLIERLFRAGVSDMYISLDSLDPETFNVINGMARPGTFERVFGNIMVAAEMSKRFGSHLYLNTVIRKDNIGEIDAIHDLSRELKCMVAFYGLEVAAEDDELNLRAYDPDLKPTDDVRKQLVEAFEHIKALKKKSISLFQSDKLLDGFRDFFKDPNANMRWKCSAGALYLEVLPEGTISVCNATPTIPGYDYRNLPELYAREDREDIFNRYRTTCSGCICTRQVEDAARNPGDLIEKAKVYMKTLFG